MKLGTSILVGSFASYALSFSIPSVPKVTPANILSHNQKPLGETLDAWIKREEQVALDRLLANIKPGGVNLHSDPDVVDGTIIASPSKEKPDYWYQCTHPPSSFHENGS